MPRRQLATAVTALACLGCLPLVCGSASAAPAWLAPTALSPVGAFESADSVGVDSAGRVTAVWGQSTGDGQVVVAAVHPNSGGWQAPVDVSGHHAEGVGSPQVAVDARGDATAVWAELSDGDYVVTAATRPAGGSWGTPVALSAPSFSPNLEVPYPRVAVNAQGDATAIWDFYDIDNATVQATVRSAKGSWQKPVDLAPVSYAEFPQVAIDAHGDATAVWPAYNGTNTIVQAATRPAGGTWPAPVDLSATDENAVNPQVAVDPHGNATAVWEHSSTINPDTAVHLVQAAARPAGGSWGAPVSLSTTGGVNPQVAVNAQGDATAVWDHYAGVNEANAQHDVQTAVRPAGGAWHKPAALSGVGTELSYPQVAVNARGDAIAAWDQGGKSPYFYHTAQAAVRPADAAWHTPVALAAASVGYEAPVAAIDTQGNATAVWHLNDGDFTTLQAAGYDAAGPLLRGVSIPSSGRTGVPVSFSVSPLDAWSPVATTRWNFGDGHAAIDEIVTHTYANPGTYKVSISSFDTLANITSVTRDITIAPATANMTPATTTTTQPSTHQRSRTHTLRFGSVK
jgi:hypothetical protein